VLEASSTNFTVADKFVCTARTYMAAEGHHTAVILPALGVPVDKYMPFAERLLKNGVNIVMADMPGCVGQRPKPSRKDDYGYGDLVTDYIPALVAIAQKCTPERTPILIGHGLGGHIAALYATSDGAPCSVVGIGAGNIWFNLWPGFQKLLTLRASLMFYIYTAIYGYLPGKKVGFGYHEASKLMRDWAKIALTGRFDHIKFRRSSQHASTNKALFIAIKDDSWAPITSIRGLARQLSRSHIVQVETPAPKKGNRHSSWITDSGSIASAVISGLNEGMI
jgi:predicted alpha/beta hydrolase